MKRKIHVDPRKEAWLAWHSRMFGTPLVGNESAWRRLFSRWSK